MTVILGGITLNPSLQWTNQHEFQSMAQSVKRTLGGGQVIYQQPLFTGFAIELEATDDSGWFTYDMVTALQTLALQTDTIHVFSWFGTDYNVIFDYASGALNFERIQYRQVPQSDDYFTGSINLLTA